MGSGQRTRGTLWPRLGLAAAAAAIGLAVAELVLRGLGVAPVAVNPDQRSLWQYHERLGWWSLPSHQTLLDYGSFRADVRTNTQGLRGPERPIEKPPGVRRVLLLGDSFAWGFGVGQDDMLASQLEDRLPNTEVVNGGVSGYSTDQSLLWLREHGLAYAPDDIVLVMAGNDDIMNHMQLAYWVYYKPTYQLADDGRLRLRGVPVPRTGWRRRWTHSLRSRSALAKAIEVAWSGREAAFVYLADALPDPADPHRLTRALVSAIRAEAERTGASFRVVADPAFWFSPQGSHPRLVEELRAAGHEVLDMAVAPGFDHEAMRIPGDGHWNAAGHRYVADELARRLALP